jgi:hypothetical protein
MNRSIQIRTSLLAAVFALAAGAASAQVGASLAPKTTPAGIAYVSGGVGNAQQQAMKDAMKDYDLRLTFAREQTGSYLASVKVTIDRRDGDHAGTLVLDTVSGGPMLFVKLPDGKYDVRAEVERQVQTRTVSIRQGQAQDLVIHFPAKHS